MKSKVSEPAAFLSYVRSDDQHENGRLTEFCKRLSGEVRMQTGEAFHVFQDRNDIAWGEQWKLRVEGALDAVTFLVPIVTPGFFNSPACREEFERFLERERDLERNDLILPVYYVNSPILDDEVRREVDAIAGQLAKRQYADWRELRFEPFTAPLVGKTLAHMAGQLVAALERTRPPQIPVAVPAARKPGGAAATITGEPAQQTGGRAGPSSKTEPPTLVVDALHRGDHATIAAALQAAAPGDRILVRAGLYRESLVIDKPIEIIGEGEPGDVVIESTEQDAILFQTSMGRVSNLTLRQLGAGKWFCVDIAQGRLDLEGCNITSQSLACVAIHGGADPRLRRNRIHDGKSSGVYVYENGLGTLEDNEIFANAIAGVAIAEGGNPTLRRNRIHDGKQSGVYIHEDGRGTLEDNDIFANAIAGVEIKGGNPVLRGNRISDGKTSGVLIHENGLGTLEDNEIFANALSGVEIKQGSNPTLRRNRIHDGKQGGVYIHENGRGTLEDNEIFANTFAGVEIKDGGDPTLRRNRIHDGKQSGVYIHDDGRGTLEDNEIVANANVGVSISDGGNPTLRRNRITESGYQAIWIRNGGQGTFEDNDLRGNAAGAWNIADDCKEKVTRQRNQE